MNVQINTQPPDYSASFAAYIKLACKMRDPYNPTNQELIEWLRTPNAQAPVEDWDLVITDEHSIAFIFDLASMESSSNWSYFLGCLYIFVADAWRTNFSAYPRESVDALFARVSDTSPSYIIRWRKRSESLLSGEEKDDYSLWSGHGYANMERGNAD